jgi:uncharacterized protein (TIGR02757 family)
VGFKKSRAAVSSVVGVTSLAGVGSEVSVVVEASVTSLAGIGGEVSVAVIEGKQRASKDKKNLTSDSLDGKSKAKSRARSSTGKNTRKAYKTIGPRKLQQLKPWLDEIIDQVEVPEYIPDDPVSFMHAFDGKEDRLLAGFFAAIMAWGRRDIVIRKVDDLLKRMDYAPEAYIRGFNEVTSRSLDGFCHRTFTSADVYWLTRCLQAILLKHGHFEAFWADCYAVAQRNGEHLMDVFHDAFFAFHNEAPQRTRKHIASKRKKSSCKRLLLYLRWAVRKNSVVDTGLMDFIPTSELYIPLDVHVARQARKLGLLGRHQNDWYAVEELQQRLIKLDPSDPCRYDYALFGIGVLKKDIPKNLLINSVVED